MDGAKGAKSGFKLLHNETQILRFNPSYLDKHREGVALRPL
jgi:hypothetical protein